MSSDDSIWWIVVGAAAIAYWFLPTQTVHEYYCFPGWDGNGCSDRDGATWHNVKYLVNSSQKTIAMTDYSTSFQVRGGVTTYFNDSENNLLSSCQIVDVSNWSCSVVNGADGTARLADGVLVESSNDVRGTHLSWIEYTLHYVETKLRYSYRPYQAGS